MHRSKNIKIALVGQPNVGKSMLINSISNAKMHVGNFTGVTVEKAEAFFEYEGYRFTVVDLPGTYSLNDYSLDEKVTKDFLLKHDYDLILNVVDSTNLEKNLLLTAELFELNKKMIIALNFSDEAEKEKIEIDEKNLAKIMGVPCVKVSASTKKGINNLLKEIIQTYENITIFPKLVFSDAIEEEIEKIIIFLRERNYKSELDARAIAVKLLKDDKEFFKKIHEEPIWIELRDIVKKSHEHIYLHFDTKDINEIFTEEKHAFAKGAFTEAVLEKKVDKKTPTQKIDAVLINKYLGIPIFLFFMWFLFQATFELGSIPMGYIDSFFSFLSEKTISFIPNETLASLIGDGIIAGVGAVVLFLPNIMILFFGIALLEGTGYMSRIAFLLDGFFHKFGLHGKSFIPLVTGFGCSVPAYMSARTLKNEKDRMITLFIISFMSCGAKLPVYVLFIGAFFSQEDAGNILFFVYIFGALLGLAAAKFLRLTVFKGASEPFVMEMPKYRMPSLKLLWHIVYTKSLMYLKKAGTFILGASVLIWFASSYPKNSEITDSFNAKIELLNSESEKLELGNELKKKLLEESYLGMIGKATQPFFEPLGFSWQMTVALETGLAAKEVIVATLGVLYSLGDNVDETSNGLAEEIRKNISFASGLSFIVFVMIYLPCLAASAVFTKEAGGYKYLGYLIVFTTATAYTLSFLTYKMAGLF
ncbi:MAG: ferrous iron transport protein [Campylobacterota bacterium]|nr:ferrous iron transport protein [Campylobacterota bacterium]